jgi:hypothetical protein
MRPNEQVLSTVKEIFGIFGEALGVKVNYRKIIATLMREGMWRMRIELKAVLRYEIANFPIKYELNTPVVLIVV